MTETAFLKQEYITTRESLRELAQRYGVSYSALRHRAQREHWTQARREAAEGKNGAQTQAALARQRQANGLFADFLLQILQREELRQSYLGDGRGLKDYIAALAANEQLQRRLCDLPTALEREKLSLEREKLSQRSEGESAGETEISVALGELEEYAQ